MRTKLKPKIARKGLVTRYFLRRLAQAQHDGIGSRYARAYTRALAEVIAVFILMPGISLFSAAAWYFSSMPPGRWLVDANARATLGAAMLVTFGLVLAGHFVFGHHFRRYRRDPEAASEFDSEEDRQIAFWQKFFVTAICGVLVPLCTLINITHP
ncbi:MAG: hypothetical protein ACREUG_06330 [Steroidobacteraceae bacterium]